MMLFILALLGILVASFAFEVNAHRAAVYATQNQVQLRLAAESGIQHALLILRETRHDPSVWYDNEELFHNQVVWSMLGDEARRDVDEELDRTKMTFRYSLVADDPLDDHASVRYGITDESSKLNLNLATAEQLATLFSAVLPEETEIEPLIDALLDWRDQDDELREQGAEMEHYMALDPPYTIKNGSFETVEELLLVAGFAPEILYGEDFNRNGILDPNEQDGDLRLPLDNQDDVLHRGVYPYLTVWSRDLNRSNDNLPRLDLNGDLRELQEGLSEFIDEEIINYIIASRNNGTTFNSPVELLDGSYTVGGNTGNGKAPGGGDGKDVGANDDANTGNGGSGGSGAPGPPVFSPVSIEDLPALCDRTTAIRQPGQMGLININTAPRAVLRCLVNGSFSEEDVDAIIAARANLEGDQLATVAWPLTESVISQEALASIYAQITARAQQFHIEAIGHADHLGMMVRLQAVVELRGHVPQYMYYRDLTALGTYPIRGTREGDEVVRSQRR
ncbi:MAG: general secretion pathway protein GspK [Planctomycetes bacterium]|nr:general secretion pathway protein GspK [Planctomycetota bacterium]